MAKVVRGNGWSIRITNDKLQLKLTKAAPILDKQMRFAMRDIGNDIAAEVIMDMRNFSKGRKGRKAPIQLRTGALARTVSGRHFGSTVQDLRAEVTAGSGSVPYARVQEFGTIGAGGTLPDIKPKKRFLRMPLDRILTAQGGAVKGDYELVERAKGDWVTAGGKPTWISGRAIMIEEHGKNVPIWALITSAKIPPRLGIGRAIDKNEPMIRDRFIEAIDRTIGEEASRKP